MHISRQYKLPHNAARFLSTRMPSLQAARLVHGLLCQVAISCGGLPAAGPSLMRERTIWCADIADLTAARGCRDHRWIDRGLADLADVGLFKALRREDPRRLTFLFTERFRDTLKSNNSEGGFGMLQTEDLAAAVTTEEAIFVMLVRLVEGRDWPVIDLPFRAAPSKASLRLGSADGQRQDRFGTARASDPQSPSQPDWHAVKKRWCRAVERVASRLDHSYLIAPQRGPLDDRPTRVVVKVQHAKTSWQPERLYKFGAGTGRVIQILPGQPHRSLNERELRDRLRSTVVR
ncbi:hypothetical protein LR948_12155 [Roseivivax sp. GX 12232]|uniref:hypothetical protein n=1 Tax=Roseivivax sp. GX 12232 TaxID=2900547 RepID=UPI001E4A6E2F|nr:hypothetical protein [Roseivivax sp. GX 12232]MCE0506114.1 hypothetical protein [Roseivivax sp. GX 12232]